MESRGEGTDEGEGTGERAGMRAVLGLVLVGLETALRERREEPWGAAREDALLAALRLIRTAFSHDLDVVAALRRTVHTGVLT
jgi:hypothetical protein